MTEYLRIDERFAVGLGQPGEAELATLAREGFKAVVNLRAAGEAGQALSPEQEGERVAALGMAYRHVPVAPDKLGPQLVDRFRREVSHLPGPIYVHCASGKRSGAFTMMHVAAEQGLSGEQALRAAERLGFECDSAALERFVRDYVDQHGPLESA